jgi:hypothetical protein
MQLHRSRALRDGARGRVHLNRDGLDTERTILWTGPLNLAYTGVSARPEFAKRPAEAQTHLMR